MFLSVCAENGQKNDQKLDPDRSGQDLWCQDFSQDSLNPDPKNIWFWNFCALSDKLWSKFEGQKNDPKVDVLPRKHSIFDKFWVRKKKLKKTTFFGRPPILKDFFKKHVFWRFDGNRSQKRGQKIKES